MLPGKPLGFQEGTAGRTRVNGEERNALRVSRAAGSPVGAGVGGGPPLLTLHPHVERLSPPCAGPLRWGLSSTTDRRTAPAGQGSRGWWWGRAGGASRSSG